MRISGVGGFFKILLILGLVGALNSCASLPTPETPREKLAAAEISFKNVVDELKQQYLKGNISDEHLRILQIVVKNGNGILDDAHTALDLNNDQQALLFLNRLTNIIADLQAELAKAKTGDASWEMRNELITYLKQHF